MQENPVVIFIQETKCATEARLMLMIELWKGLFSTSIHAKGALG